MLGGLGYYFSLPGGGGSWADQILGIVAVILSVVAIVVTGPAQ